MHTVERKQTFTETARRAQILQAAIATINQLGYHRASLAEIADHAGVAKSAIVYYFGSKENLLMQVLDDTFTALGTAVEAAVSEESTPHGRLRAYAESYLSHVDTHRAEVAAAVTIVLSHRASDGTPLYLTVSEDDTALLRSILDTGMESGHFRRMPLADAVHIAESLLDLAITTVQRDLAADLSTLAQEITRFLLDGLGTRVSDQPGRPDVPSGRR